MRCFPWSTDVLTRCCTVSKIIIYSLLFAYSTVALERSASPLARFQKSPYEPDPKDAHRTRLIRSDRNEALVEPSENVAAYHHPGPLLPPTENEHLLRPDKCIPIEIPLCKNIGYNLTYMPNAFHHETQEEAGLEVHQFYPLVEINCSEDLRLFLCSMYTPICLPNWRYRLTACRSLCESARDGCMPVMKTHGFAWPERMNCDLLPEGNECVSRRNSSTTHVTNELGTKGPLLNSNSVEKIMGPSTIERDRSMNPTNLTAILINELLMTLKVQYPTQANKLMGRLLERSNELQRSVSRFIQNDPTGVHGEEQLLCLPCRCRDPFVSVHKPPFNEVTTGGITGCMSACRNPSFNSKSDKTFTTFWLGLWAVLCTLSTLATVLTFIADPGRFQYPERPIIYLSACYLMVALGFLIRVGLGHESIACDGPMIRRGSTGPAQCSIVFLLIYVFGMASSVWWVILTLTWFLAAGLKWGSEAIAKYSQLYHFVAWFFPGAQAALIFILSAVDGDPVGGLCYVGSTDANYLRMFVLGPMCIYLGLGTAFLLAGFVALFKIRSAIKLQARGQLKTDKLEKLMIRIGIFGVLYTVPATVVIGCICYELLHRDAWQRNHNCPCIPSPKLSEGWQESFVAHVNMILGKQRISDGPNGIETIQIDKALFHSKDVRFHQNPRPEHAVFMLKYFMSLVVGITSGFWIWSSKTVDSWQSCLRRAARNSWSGPNKRIGTVAVVSNQTSPLGPSPSNRSPGPAGSAVRWNSGSGKNFVRGRNIERIHLSPTGGWSDDLGPTSRLLPQLPPPAASVNVTCHHAFSNSVGFIANGNGSGSSTSGNLGIQANVYPFTTNSVDGFGTMNPNGYCSNGTPGQSLENGAIHMVPVSSLAHI